MAEDNPVQMVFGLPPTIALAVEAGSEAARSIVVNKWRLAAIVAAFVRLGAGQGKRALAENRQGRMSARAFAKLGIPGLADKETVAKYLRIWIDAMGDCPEPGDEVVLPVHLGWPGPGIQVPADEGVVVDDDLVGYYAENHKPADDESDGQRRSAGVHEIVLVLPKEDGTAARFADSVQKLMGVWKISAVRDVVLRAVHEAAARVTEDAGDDLVADAMEAMQAASERAEAAASVEE